MDKFSINDYEFTLEDHSNLLRLVIESADIIKSCNQQYFFIERKPQQYSLADSIVLLSMGLLYRSVYCVLDSCSYDITFSYNFPIVYEKHLVPTIIEAFPYIVKAQLVTLGISEEFSIVDVSSAASYQVFIEKNGCLMRRNDKAIYIEIRNNLYEILMNWQKYCAVKFHRQYSMDAIYAYMKIYSLEGFRALTYFLNGEIVSQGVLYHSTYSKTNYYCIFSWNEKFRTRSPGIYAYIKVIEESHQTGYKFSFCYGSQSYKSALLLPFMYDENNSGGGFMHV
jgi:hypothetical protein